MKQKYPIKQMISDKSYNLISMRENGTIDVETHNLDPSMSIPDDQNSTDINNIMAQYKITGQMPHSGRQGLYDEHNDIPTPNSLLEAYSLIQDASEKFLSLPSQLREKFHNDPSIMAEFLQDPSNYQAAVDLGLLTAQPKNDELNDKNDAPKKSPKKQPEPES